jgi:di/tricarboxylate transporter
VSIIAIERSGRFAQNVVRPVAGTKLRAGDVLFIDLLAPEIDIEEIRARFALEQLPRSGAYFSDRSQEIGMVEVTIPPTSKLIGKTVVESRFRSEYDLAVVGLKHGSTAHSAGLLDEALKLGDTLLLVGPWKAIRRLQSDWKDLIVLDLPAEVDDVVPAAARAPHALLALALVVAIGCLLMGLLHCIDLDSAYRSIHWQSLVLIVGMLPFALALQKTGGNDLAATALIDVMGDATPAPSSRACSWSRPGSACSSPTRQRPC